MVALPVELLALHSGEEVIVAIAHAPLPEDVHHHPIPQHQGPATGAHTDCDLGGRGHAAVDLGGPERVSVVRRRVGRDRGLRGALYTTSPVGAAEVWRLLLGESRGLGRERRSEDPRVVGAAAPAGTERNSGSSGLAAIGAAAAAEASGAWETASAEADALAAEGEQVPAWELRREVRKAEVWRPRQQRGEVAAGDDAAAPVFALSPPPRGSRPVEPHKAAEKTADQPWRAGSGSSCCGRVLGRGANAEETPDTAQGRPPPRPPVEGVSRRGSIRRLRSRSGSRGRRWLS